MVRSRGWIRKGRVPDLLFIPFAIVLTALPLAALAQYPPPQVVRPGEMTERDREAAAREQAAIAAAREEAIRSGTPEDVELLVNYVGGFRAILTDRQDIHAFEADFVDSGTRELFYQSMNLMRDERANAPWQPSRLVCRCTGLAYTHGQVYGMVLTDFSLSWEPVVRGSRRAVTAPPR